MKVYASQQAPSNALLSRISGSGYDTQLRRQLWRQNFSFGTNHWDWTWPYYIPMRERKVHSTEPPWITSSLKTGDDQMFNELRNRFNLERRMCRANYYQAKVEHLKKCKPSEWCKEVKKLSGHSLASTAQSDTLKWLQHLHHWGYWPNGPS